MCIGSPSQHRTFSSNLVSDAAQGTRARARERAVSHISILFTSAAGTIHFLGALHDKHFITQGKILFRRRETGNTADVRRDAAPLKEGPLNYTATFASADEIAPLNFLAVS